MGKHIRFDWAMKRLLRQKSNFVILEGFLSELLMQDIKIQEILDSESNKLREDDKFNRVDILVKNTNDELMLIEVQNEKEHDYFHRMNYGQAKLISEHINSGDSYEQIKKVFSINIVYFELGQGKDYIYSGTTQFKGVHNNDTLNLNSFQKSKYQNLKNVSDIFANYYILKVNNFNDIAINSLDEWIYFLKNSNIKDEFKAKGLPEAKEKMRTDNLNTADRNDYEAYLKDQRIKESEINTAIFDTKTAIENKLMPIIEKEKKKVEQKEIELNQEKKKLKQKEIELNQEKKKAEQEKKKAEQKNLELKQEKKKVEQKTISTIKKLSSTGMSNKEISECTGEKLEYVKKALNKH